MIRQGLFREDLFYRLNVAPIRLPPLRERSSDVPALVRHFASLATREGLPLRRLDDAAIERLRRHPWPGNVRELENEVQRLVIQADPESYVSVELLSDRVRGSEVLGSPARSHAKPQGTLKQAMDEFEREVVLGALASHANNKTKAAKSLGITREGLHKKLKQLGIG